MIRVKEQNVAIEGNAIDLLSEYGLLTAEMFATSIPEDMICRTIKLAFEIKGIDIIKLITCDLEMTENLKQAIEDYKQSRENKKESD